jgi:DNA-binding NarL/FixJ family response regulator
LEAGGGQHYAADMPGCRHIADKEADDVRTLVASADRCLTLWAHERQRAAAMTVCGQAADLEAAVVLAGELRPDVCLLDVALSGGALEALHRMREQAPETRTVMLATSPDDPSLLAAVRAGASGCIVGMPAGSALGRALADVMAGHTALPRTLLTRLVATLGPA